VGQLKNSVCPVCEGPNEGKWTCDRCTPLLKVHREMILIAGDGNEYCLWDIKAFYDYRTELPERMRQAIEMCLYLNMVERKAAEAMGLAPANPVAIYANVGIARLLSWSFQGKMGTYNPFVWTLSLEASH
jgi:hypothetical protein